MSFYSEAIKSNTLWQPKDSYNNAEEDFRNMVYFTLTQKSSDALQKSIKDSNTPQIQKDYYTNMAGAFPLWKFMLLAFVEDHSEAFSMDKGLSDSFTIMSTGTNCIRVAMSGLLYKTKEYDYRLDFLYIYENYLRGYKLEDNDCELQVVVEDTQFYFKPFGLQYSQNTMTPDFDNLNMVGVAYHYSNPDITGSLSTAITGL